MKEKYKFSFEKVETPSGRDFDWVNTLEPENEEIANHLVSSGITDTKSQITALQKALNGELIQEDWGEVKGSTLDIFPEEGNVQIAYCNRRIPIEDFKQLLEEWLDFIS